MGQNKVCTLGVFGVEVERRREFEGKLASCAEWWEGQERLLCIKIQLDQCGSVGVSSYTLKGCRFNPHLGHEPRLQV